MDKTSSPPCGLSDLIDARLKILQDEILKLETRHEAIKTEEAEIITRLHLALKPEFQCLTEAKEFLFPVKPEYNPNVLTEDMMAALQATVFSKNSLDRD